MRERLAKLPDGTDVEYRIVRPDGAVRWVRGRAYPIRNAAGELRRIVGTVEDITERRQLEEQLNAAQKMEAIGRLAAGLAHDFNNLLTVITGCAELLVPAVSVEEHGDGLAEIMQAAQRATGLTRQLLAFSRQQVLRPRVLDVNAVVGAVTQMVSRIIGEDIEVLSDLASDLGVVRADSGQLEQVLMNLAVNARDAMPQGGRLSFRTGTVEVGAAFAERHRGLLPGSYVTLAVTDTGCGMSPEVRARVFEPFYTTKEPGKGTGLGLSTVYGIVKQSGGFIDLMSEVDKGSTFTIYLPRISGVIQPEAAEMREGKARPGTETILLVEDDEAVRRVGMRILRQLGYTVLMASDGQEALVVSERHPGPIHLICTDIVMPGLNGFEVVERIRVRYPEIGVLITSGYSSVVITDHTLEASKSVFLQKPYTIAELTERVQEALNRAQPSSNRDA